MFNPKNDFQGFKQKKQFPMEDGSKFQRFQTVIFDEAAESQDFKTISTAASSTNLPKADTPTSSENNKSFLGKRYNHPFEQRGDRPAR